MIGRHIEIRGVVQGVGFRPWVWQLAHAEGVAGRVRNDAGGVIIDAFGPAQAVENFTLRLGQNQPPAAQVREIDWREIPAEAIDDFSIVASESATERNVSIPPDLATCDDCLAEVLDPANRRYRYPFTNCTNCGPRYTIVRGAPYDRAETSMAAFTMCDECQREYDDPRDRRFHAQPNACPACGPELIAVTPNRREISTGTPIEFAARALRAQLIVAVKGLGGFHLACDATSPVAVNRLRERKRREAKPLAVMVRDLEKAEELAELTNAERALLVSVERPIVLVRRRKGCGLAHEIAGDSPIIGLFLPYTPLHHLLVRAVDLPLVMTSGNYTDEPMCTTNEKALERLGPIADVFLLHNRDIETRADDSVVRVIDGAPLILRRARGYVPRGIELATPFAEPILAVGAQLKNAIAIGAGRSVFLGPHVGDLDSLDSMQSFEDSIAQMQQFVGVTPRIVVHDLHPQYVSTRWANRQPDDIERVAVQHHHAHVAAAMAEHGLEGPVVGVAYDGTGFGTDGTSWGGEILIATYTGFERFATFRPIPLAGGDQAVRQVWRVALALLDDAFEKTPPLHRIPLFRDMERPAVDAIRRMIALGLNAPLARGVGRYFDAFGALCLTMPDARYEGEVALQWNMAADEDERGRYEVVIRDGASPWEIDPRPMVKQAVNDLIAGVAPATISAKFHNTIAGVTIELARAASGGKLPIVLTGGCFQNAFLAERILHGLSGAYLSRQIPPGDGGIALGQAVIANAQLRAATQQPSNAATEVPSCA